MGGELHLPGGVRGVVFRAIPTRRRARFLRHAEDPRRVRAGVTIHSTETTAAAAAAAAATAINCTSHNQLYKSLQ